MGKISLDATIQRDVPERNRTSAFARSETLLQLSWVIGGVHRHRACPLESRKLGLGVLAGADGALDGLRARRAARQQGPAQGGSPGRLR